MARTNTEENGGATVRATISFPANRYDELEEIARQKKVSLAWVVREAVDNYIDARTPLFASKDRRS
jgi:metal-responsive CopG/Arc/MetJ family transcriptional regulator